MGGVVTSVRGLSARWSEKLHEGMMGRTVSQASEVEGHWHEVDTQGSRETI